MSDPEDSTDARPPRRWWRWLRDRLLVLGLAIAIVLGVIVLLFESSFIYYPARASEDWYAKPGFRARDCAFDADDGVTLHGWHVTATREPSTATLLFFHGNAGNLSHRTEICEMLCRAGLDVFIIDYRGYGKSADVAPSEDGLYRDGRAAWAYLTGELGVPAERVVLLGESLGGAVATQLATERDAAALVTVSTFTRISDMALTIVPIPLGWALSHKMDNLAKVATIETPTLICHGTRDTLITPSHAERLRAASAGRPVELQLIEGAEHNDIWDARLVLAIKTFVEKVVR